MAAALAAVLAPSAAMAAGEAAESQGSWLTLLFFAANFLVFAFILGRFATPQARKYFADRAVSIRTSLSRAEGALAEAQELASRAVARMATIEQDLAQLASELDAETAYQAGRMVESARAAAQRIAKDTELGAAAMADAAQRRVRQRLAATAAALARDLIGRHFEAHDQGRLVDGFMERLGREVQR